MMEKVGKGKEGVEDGGWMKREWRWGGGVCASERKKENWGLGRGRGGGRKKKKTVMGRRGGREGGVGWGGEGAGFS